MPRYTDAQRADMVSLYETGLGYGKVADRFGCSHNTVAAAIKAAGIVPKKSGGQIRSVGSIGKWSRRIDSNGYAIWYAWVSGENRYMTIYEHRLIMGWMLGRPLRPHEEPHHKNGVRHDNSPTNLELRRRYHGPGATHCDACGESLTPNLLTSLPG